jgi:hypothetical protein
LGSQAGPARLDRLDEEIRLAAATLDKDSATELTNDDVAILDTLIAEHLLHEFEGTDNHDSVKFYIALRRDQPTAHFPDEFDQLRDACSEGTQAWYGISLYRGAGFGDYIIKAMVDRFSEVLDVQRALAPLFGRLRMRSTTLVVADRFSRESDRCDVSGINFDGYLRQLEQGLSPPNAARLRALSEREQEQIRLIYRSNAALLGSRAEDIFFAAFEAWIARDFAPLAEKLGFIPRLERLVRTACDQLWQEMGDGWEDIVSEALADIHITNQRRETLALADHARVLAKLIELGRLNRPEVDAALGPQWRDALLVNQQDVRQLRNDVAHGDVWNDDFSARRIFPRAEDETAGNEMTARFMNIVLLLASVYTHLLDRNEELGR